VRSPVPARAELAWAGLAWVSRGGNWMGRAVLEQVEPEGMGLDWVLQAKVVQARTPAGRRP